MRKSDRSLCTLVLCLTLFTASYCSSDSKTGEFADADTVADVTPADTAVTDDTTQDTTQAETAQQDTADEDTAQADQDAVEPSRPLVVVVLQPDANGEFKNPAVGAAVALDQPEGERVEQIVGEDGRAVFADIDWTLGAATVTCYLEGHTILSSLGITTEELEQSIDESGAYKLEFWMSPLEEEPEMVEISGTALNMKSQQNYLTVTATIPATLHQAPGPEWSLAVTAAQDFSLIALEWFPSGTSTVSSRGTEQEFVNWAIAGHEAVTEPATFDIDMNRALETFDVSGSLALPDHGFTNFFDIARVYGRVTSLDSDYGVFLGAPTWLDVGEDGRIFDYNFQYVKPDGVVQPLTQFQVWDVAGRVSQVFLPGFVQDGPLDVVVPEPVLMTNPQALIPMQEAITWEMNPVDQADPNLSMELRLLADNRFLWTISLPRDSTSAILPKLPSTADPGVVFPYPFVEAYVLLYEFDEELDLLTRLSAGKTVKLQP